MLLAYGKKTWQINSAGTQAQTSALQRPYPYRAPSWSWAALGGASIDVSERSDGGRWIHYRAIVVTNVDVKPKIEGDLFGEVLSASLVIRCFGMKLLPWSKWKTNIGSREGIFEWTCDQETIVARLDLASDERNLPEVVFLLIIITAEDSFCNLFTLEGLILQESTLHFGCNHYERLGRFDIKSNSSEAEQSGQESSDGYGSEENEDELEQGDASSVAIVDKQNDFSGFIEWDSADGQYGDELQGFSDDSSSDEAEEAERRGPCINRSFIWSSLEDASMHQRAPQEGESEDVRERFIIL
jgi:hypothetical protein